MPKRVSSLVVQIGGLVVFACLVVVVVLFASGYLYDSNSKDLVQYGVISIMDTDFKNLTVSVDSQIVTPAIPGEIRLPPGKHVIRLSRHKYTTFEKEVFVPDDVVMKFSKIRLVPETITDEIARPLVFGPMWKRMYTELDGFFVANQNLGMGLYFPFQNPLNFTVYDTVMRGKTWMLSGKRELSEYVVSTNTPQTQNVLPKGVRYLSRVGETFHFLVLREDRTLDYCDLDFENCHTMMTVTEDRIDASDDRNEFVVKNGDTFILLDFHESGALPKILHDLISRTIGIR